MRPQQAEDVEREVVRTAEAEDALPVVMVRETVAVTVIVVGHW